MECGDRSSFEQARGFLRHLRHLGNMQAPAAVLPTVLERIGHGDAYALCASPLGPVYVAYNGLGISLVMEAASATEFEQAFRVRFKRLLRRVETLPVAVSRTWEQQRRGKALPRVDLRGLTEFERAVLSKACEIPPGEMRPYAWVAREIGHPGAVRAVGSALGRNPIPILIPCHRIGQSDGRIGNYAFGSPAKRTILAAEGVDIEALEQLAHRGIRYHGSDTTHIYCFPTCRHARRLSVRHRVSFRSAAAAAAAGYRPCTVCRPALAA